jgi:hypothetical protein
MNTRVGKNVDKMDGVGLVNKEKPITTIFQTEDLAEKALDAELNTSLAV